MVNRLDHFDDDGASRMVDVSRKAESERTATASGRVRMKKATAEIIADNGIQKGDVLEVARLAGIMAAKRTSDLIPLCHPFPITGVSVDYDWEREDVLHIAATVRVIGRTGVEMEAPTAVAVTALTVYDMCKAVDKSMTIESIRLEEKTGGASGPFRRTD